MHVKMRMKLRRHQYELMLIEQITVSVMSRWDDWKQLEMEDQVVVNLTVA